MNNSSECSNLDALKRKILYRCHYRGVRELDMLFGRFIDEGRHALINDWVLFEQFLNEPEPLLMNWLLFKISPPDEYLTLIKLIKP